MPLKHIARKQRMISDHDNIKTFKRSVVTYKVNHNEIHVFTVDTSQHAREGTVYGVLWVQGLSTFAMKA